MHPKHKSRTQRPQIKITVRKNQGSCLPAGKIGSIAHDLRENSHYIVGVQETVRVSGKRMNVSHPAVHPVGVPPVLGGQAVPPRMRMRVRMEYFVFQGMPLPGSLGGLMLRLGQFCSALIAFSVMVSIRDFSVTAFCYLLAATVLQCLWSLALAVIDVYALLVKRSLRNPLLVSIFVVGDGVTATLTFAAACASAGVVVLIGNDMSLCKSNPCANYEAAIIMAFLSWFMVSVSFVLTFWMLATL